MVFINHLVEIPSGSSRFNEVMLIGWLKRVWLSSIGLGDVGDVGLGDLEFSFDEKHISVFHFHSKAITSFTQVRNNANMLKDKTRSA